jgi:SMC interacting uncharacterized protein involved in chromosome segregation
MEQELDNTNWYKASLLKIADDFGTPHTSSNSDIQKLFKNAFGIYVKKEAAQKLSDLIKNTKPNSQERMDSILTELQDLNFSKSNIAIMRSMLAPYGKY